MYQSSAPIASSAAVSFLLSPNVVLVIDMFRALGDFEENYDLSALDRLEDRLATLIDPCAARGLVSDALLLGFALRTERSTTWSMHAVGSRRATAHEYRLLGLVAACMHGDTELAAEALRGLGVAGNHTILSLAGEVAQRLAVAGVELDPPDARLVSDDEGDILTLGSIDAPARRHRAGE
jgi:hypothetical protein